MASPQDNNKFFQVYRPQHTKQPSTSKVKSGEMIVSSSGNISNNDDINVSSINSNGGRAHRLPSETNQNSNIQSDMSPYYSNFNSYVKT